MPNQPVTACIVFVVFSSSSVLAAETLSNEEALAEKEGRTICSCLQDMACDERLPRKRIKSIAATSTLKGNKGPYAPTHLLDDDMATAWCEGANGSGIGERVTVELSKPTKLQKILLSPMYAKSATTIRDNNRLKWVTIILDGQPFKLVVLGYVDDECGGDQPCPAPASLQTWDIPETLQKKPVTKVELVVESVIKGAKFDDTCLSEFGVVALEED